jgi:hypothetical protein
MEICHMPPGVLGIARCTGPAMNDKIEYFDDTVPDGSALRHVTVNLSDPLNRADAGAPRSALTIAIFLYIGRSLTMSLL